MSTVLAFTNAVTGERQTAERGRALSYATMLYDACGIVLDLTREDGTPFPYRFTERGTAVAA